MLRRAKFVTFGFAITALLMLGGFGCKGLSSAQVAAMKPVSLEYWTVFDDVDALQGEITKYRMQRPYLSVNVRQFRADEIYQRLIEALAEDRGPDIISISNRSVGRYVTKLHPAPATASDVTILVEKGTLGTNTTVNTNVVSVIDAGQLDREYVQTVKRDVMRNGNIYGLPLSLDTMAIYYNKDLLDRAGIPEPPKTWEEFQADVKKLTKYDKTSNKILQSGAALGTGSNVPGMDDILAILFKQSGIDMVEPNGNAVFNGRVAGTSDVGPAGAVLTFYTDFANPARDTYTWNNSLGNALDAFVNGKVGFFFGYSYHNKVIQARAPQLNFRVMPLLQLNPDQPVNAANYWIQSVISKSKHQNEAWALIGYLTHSPATKDYLTASGRPTALRVFIADQKQDPNLGPFVSQVLVADSWYHGTNYEAAVGALGDMASEWLGTPPTPDQVSQWQQGILDRAVNKVNQTL